MEAALDLGSSAERRGGSTPLTRIFTPGYPNLAEDSRLDRVNVRVRISSQVLHARLVKWQGDGLQIHKS